MTRYNITKSVKKKKVTFFRKNMILLNILEIISEVDLIVVKVTGEPGCVA